MKKNLFLITIVSILTAGFSAAEEFENQENNVASEAAISATSEIEGKRATNLVDNNPYSVWEAEENEATLDINLGGPEEIQSVEIYLPPQFATPRKANVTLSHGLNEEDLTVVVENEAVELNVAKKNSHKFEMQGVSSQFIRLQIHSYEPDEKAMFSEIQILK